MSDDVQVTGQIAYGVDIYDTSHALQVDGSGNLKVTGGSGGGDVTVTNWPEVQPVSGTVAVSNFPATQPVSAAALPLPTGAATDAAVSALTKPNDIQLVDGSAHTQPVSGTVAVSNFPATQPVSGTVTANAGTGTFTVDASGSTVPVSGTFWQATQPISGTVTANAGSGTLLVDGSAHTQPVSGSVSVSNFPATQPVSGTVAATQSGTWTVQPGNTANTTAWKVDGSAVTQPVSGTVTANQGGTWTVQPGNTANTTAWKVDGSAVTQPVYSGSATAATATWTSATANNTTLSIACLNYPGVAVSLNITAPIAGGDNIFFEASADGGTSWYLVLGTTNGNGVAISYSLGSASQIFQFSCVGYTHFRCRLNPGITGAGNVVVTIQAVATPIAAYVIPYSLTATNNLARLSDGTTNSIVTAAGALAVDENTAANELAVTATGTTGSAVTLTLPSASGKFHYISLVEITKYFTATNAASATPLLVTTTNLPGSMVFTFGQPVGTVGTTDERIYAPSIALKSSVVTTATTIVGPATTGIIWRINAWYHAGA